LRRYQPLPRLRPLPCSSARDSRRGRSIGHRCADPVSSPSLAIDAGCGARDDSGRLVRPTTEQWLYPERPGVRRRLCLQVRRDCAVYPCPGSRDERDRRPALHHSGYDSHSASRQWNTLAHATHTRRIPNQRKLLARHNGQRLVVVNGVNARISIVATGPLFRRTRLCDAGRDINLHATRSHVTGVEAISSTSFAHTQWHRRRAIFTRYHRNADTTRSAKSNRPPEHSSDTEWRGY
jgi:hypothetical protein